MDVLLEFEDCYGSERVRRRKKETDGNSKSKIQASHQPRTLANKKKKKKKNHSKPNESRKKKTELIGRLTEEEPSNLGR